MIIIKQLTKGDKAMKFSPYLQLNGDTKEAIEFYENVFGARNLGVMTFGDLPTSPDFPLPENVDHLVAHATLEIDGSTIMLADTFPVQPSEEGNLVIICITLDDKDKAHKIFEALAEEGQTEMPLAETTFSPAFGVVKDKFGVRFQIYTELNE